ncbi:hypothetical protein BCR41DRAFT_384237 [Lobosporangium transversale]|uniref:Uncharacterized protein n=1 Tax=Lobosporangium transversale TaxID=64571 RepID=A0A1Y2GYT8_9FUNG|nr:hypothetical protein BCR41DRAFT_384237 [Lobosporangium transversale]ORZ26643.1 hypothetical protein BCR41DRAFT_384237 [Lobosporangium transversale]|eukprot:XP_021884406.1 hypothetical protein BCR41DRAFT_384237 [Lobosporangium transversale]
MSYKNQDGERNQDMMPPPPSYAAANTSSSQYAPSSQPAPQEPYYQAQPIPPSSAYVPPGSGYPPPSEAPPSGGHRYHPNAVIYVVDDDPDTYSRRNGMPVAMICFIFGLCTWVGYLFGMCFIRSPDPRERWWARACMIMCFLWSLIIIFTSIFARPRYY